MRKLVLGRLSGFSNPGSCGDRTGIQMLCFLVLPRPLVSALLPPRLRQELRGAPISVTDARRKWTAVCSWSPCQLESSFHTHSHTKPQMMWLLSCQSFSGCRVLSSLIDLLSIVLEKNHWKPHGSFSLADSEDVRVSSQLCCLPRLQRPLQHLPSAFHSVCTGHFQGAAVVKWWTCWRKCSCRSETQHFH